jgi:hypothetical protein
MIKLKTLIGESLSSPYNYRSTFKDEDVEVEDEDTGETYMKNVLSPVQIIKFKTDSGIDYLWYAKQGFYDETAWSIAFGVETGIDAKGAHQLDIGVTGKGDAFRIFATIIDITNSFIGMDENNEILTLMFTAKGENRAKLYVKRLVPLIDNFEIEDVRDIHGETNITLKRVG